MKEMRWWFVCLILLMISRQQSAFQWKGPCSLKHHSRIYRIEKKSLISKARKRDDELDSLKLDPSRFTQEQKDRFTLIEKLNKEADEFALQGGLRTGEVGEEEKEENDEFVLPVAETAWSGQSNVEISRISSQNTFDLINRPLLVFGDILAFLTFATIGRVNHQEGLNLASVVETALPFLLPWVVAGPFVGAYTQEATSSQGKVLTGILPALAISLASAFAIRYYEKGYPPPPSFIIVATLATFTLLYGWRSLYIAAFGATTDADTKKAGFFEVFKMISTLLRRW